MVCVAGDGDFLMNGQEFATAVQYDLPIIVLIMDNGMYGTIRAHQEREFPTRVVGTALNSSAGPEALRAMGLIDENGQPIIDPVRGKKTIPQGASTLVFAATSPQLARIGGVYLKDNDIAALDDEKRPLTADSIPSEATSSSIDPEAAKRLWTLSEELLHLTSPA